MKSSLILAATTLMLGAVSIAAPFVTPTFAQTTTAEAAMQTTTFAVENMTCALCPVTVKAAMEGMEGVRSVEVDFEAKTAAVVFDPSVTTPEAIAAASTNAGYPATARD